MAVGNTRLFVDFGSTFTKVVAFDLATEELLARVQVPSTVEQDITIGLEEAFSLLAQTVAIGEAERQQTVACSSAAGGLRVVCVGLVPEYTTEAGRRAVLEAAKLLADGVEGQPGLGELMLVDVGGATTDVYSVAQGKPAVGTVRQVGLPEPYAKRTVEGDLGLFHNLDTLMAIAESEDLPEGFEEAVKDMCQENSVPTGDRQTTCHLFLSRTAVRAAVDRHVGSLRTIATPDGEVLVQRGKDLTHLRWLVGAGGPISFSADPAYVLEGALFEDGAPFLLRPRSPELLVDRHYLFFALGLLAQSEPAKALRMTSKYVAPLLESDRLEDRRTTGAARRS